MRFITTEDYGNHFVAHKAMCFNRPDIAVEFLFWNNFRSGRFLGIKTDIDFDTCADSLISLAQSQYIKSVDSWHIGQMIKGLQEFPRNQERNNTLIKIEWLYLSLLDSNFNNDTSPVALNSILAEDSEFFHQIITQANDLRKRDEDESQTNIESSKKAYCLLSQWKKCLVLQTTC